MAASYIEALLASNDTSGNVSNRWNFPGGVGTPVTVTYSFLGSTPQYYTSQQTNPISNFQPFSEALKTAARQVLACYSAVCNVTFVEQTDSDAVQMRFGRSDQNDSSGFAYYPFFTYSVDGGGNVVSGSQSVTDIAGDVWIANGTAQDAVSAGAWGYHTLDHEVGHALGLKHSFDGTIKLSTAENTNQYSVMSYTEQANNKRLVIDGNGNGSYEAIMPGTPMLYDIAAVQYLYGANTATASGDTSYSWTANSAFYQTIWDGGGADTIDAGNYTLRCRIDLTAGAYSSIGIRATDAELFIDNPSAQGSFSSANLYNGQNNLAIAYGATVENAIGGSGNDTLVGNAADNTLTGGAGDDSIDGGAGADTAVYQLTGSSGTLTTQAGQSGETLVLLNGVQALRIATSNGTTTVTDLRGSATLGTDTLTNVEQVRVVDGSQAAVLNVTVPCYLRGTRILTARGKVAVEDLRVGDQLLTLSHDFRPVTWIGRRSYARAAITAGQAAEVLPIRIRRGALGHGVPHRDLHVSPGHALFFEGALIPAASLVNGLSIVQMGIAQADGPERIDYFHVLLDRHDVVFAEGAAAESYENHGNLQGFANWAECAAIRPEGLPAEPEDCFPRVCEGGVVDTVRAALLARAEAIGFTRTADPALAAVADGVAVAPAEASDRFYRFTLPARPAELRLASRSTVLAALHGRGDARRLGVPVTSLVLRGAGTVLEIGPDHPALVEGFHESEGTHRWTDGDARLPEGLLACLPEGPTTVEVRLGPSALPYYLPPADEASAMPAAVTRDPLAATA